MSDLSFTLQNHEGRHGFLYGAGRGVFRLIVPGRPVDLVEVDSLNAEPLQAGLRFAADRRTLEVMRNASVFIPNETAFGEHVRPLAQIFDCPSDYCFRVAQPIDSGCVNPVQSQIKARVDGFNGVLIVLRTPGKFPFPTADRP